jgi:hypothetical protein
VLFALYTRRFPPMLLVACIRISIFPSTRKESSKETDARPQSVLLRYIAINSVRNVRFKECVDRVVH